MAITMVLEMKFQIKKYTADIFLPYVGRTFVFESADAARQCVELELLEVRRHGSGQRPAGFRESFALLFTLHGAQPLGRSLHRIVHGDFEAADWFLTRVVAPGRDPGLVYYEAVFG